MSFQNDSISNINNLNIGIPVSQIDESGILSQEELNNLIMSQLNENKPIQTIDTTLTNVQVSSQQNYQPNHINHPIYIGTQNNPDNIVVDKYEINPNNVEDWNNDEVEANPTNWIEQMTNQKIQPPVQNNQQPTPKPKVNQNPLQNIEEPEVEKDIPKKETLKDVDPTFDLEELYNDFDKLKSGISQRIKTLEDKQRLLDSRVKTLEKFIKLDESELATQYINQTKEKTNTQYIKQLTGSILNKTELITMTMDISLKHENLILSWNKELFNIEKEKVSSYAKIRNLNKATKETDNSINDIISKVNDAVNKDGVSVSAALNELHISGYAGKPFN